MDSRKEGLRRPSNADKKVRVTWAMLFRAAALALAAALIGRKLGGLFQM